MVYSILSLFWFNTDFKLFQKKIIVITMLKDDKSVQLNHVNRFILTSELKNDDDDISNFSVNGGS